MAISSADNAAAGGRDVQSFFRELSTGYGRQTGNSTYNVIYSFLSKLPAHVLSKDAIVHDNACGVGTATFAILALAGANGPSRVEATDSSEGMINVLKARVGSDGLSTVKPAVVDSHSLSFADNTFSLSVTNISVSNFTDASACLKEIHRTLRPDGLAVVSIWSRFTVAEMVHEAQRRIKGNSVMLMKVPHEEFFAEGYLRDRMVEAGFKDVVQNEETTLIKDNAQEGLREFMLGPLTASARTGWDEEALSLWEGKVDEVLSEEVKENGGVKMTAWVVSGRK